jgi:hypothetical protein
MEASIPESIFLLSFSFSENNLLNSREIARILSLDFFFKESS